MLDIYSRTDAIGMIHYITPSLHRLTIGAFFSGMCLLLMSCSEKQTAAQKTLTIHAAASLVDVLSEIGAAYTEKETTRLRFNYAGSGALAQQLLAAPRGDIYISANREWMQKLVTAAAVKTESEQTLLTNRMVLIGHLATPQRIESKHDLCGLSIDRLFIGDPSYVPAGKYAKNWMLSIQCDASENLWQKVETSIIPSIDARAVLGQVQSMRGALGIVYWTDYLAQADNLSLLYAIPASQTETIEYKAAILKTSDHPATAERFLEFFKSEPARAILEKHGFAGRL